MNQARMLSMILLFGMVYNVSYCMNKGSDVDAYNRKLLKKKQPAQVIDNQEDIAEILMSLSQRENKGKQTSKQTK